MNAYIQLTKIYLKLAFREKPVLFFNYAFPLIFLFAFGQMAGGQASGMRQVVSMVLVIGVLSNGLFGAGVRAVVERETNILRRYKLAPITPAPIIVASIVSGCLLYIPSIILVFAIARLLYGMPIPQKMPELILFISLGAMTFRAIGMIVAAVANSVAESNVLVQFLFFPMMFLSGTSMPLSMFPPWVQVLSQFLPSSHMFTGVQGLIVRNESLGATAAGIAAMLVMTAVALFLAIKLFRWEKEERIAPAAKLYVLAVFVPFIALGVHQAYSRENLTRNKLSERQMARDRARLIRGVRVFTGDSVIEGGAVLIREGKIEQVYKDAGPDPTQIKAEAVEANGKTLLPGLIDAHVHMGPTGLLGEQGPPQDVNKDFERRLAAYLYSGVTAVRSAGDPLDQIAKSSKAVASGEILAADVSFAGPIFTTENGHGTEYLKHLPAAIRQSVSDQALRLPTSESQAATQVRELKERGVHSIKVILESGVAGSLFNRMDSNIFAAIVKEAKAQGLPVMCHTGDSRDVTEAIQAGVQSIEHGSARERIDEAVFKQMAAKGIAYIPTLAVIEAFNHVRDGRVDLLNRFLVAEVVPDKQLRATKASLPSPALAPMRQAIGAYPADLEIASENLRRAWKAGVKLVTGTDAGNMLVPHGPTVQREVHLWTQAGIPLAVALRAATRNAAELLGRSKQIGRIAPGYEASLLLVAGDPLTDPAALERIDSVFFKGERVARWSLLDKK